MSSASPSTSGSNYRRKKLSRNTRTLKAVRQAPRSRRRANSVTFQDEASVIPAEEGGAVSRQELGLREGDEEGEEGLPQRRWPFFRVFVEKKYLRLIFRYVASTCRVLETDSSRMYMYVLLVSVASVPL